ncbi:MAG: DUF554 domain-containing protein [Flexilinea sp.]|jgi:hypothetical protein
MTGTIINVAAILAGTVLGLLLGTRFTERLRDTLISGLGLFTAFLGCSMFLKSENSVISLIGIVIGTCLGEWLNIEEGLEKLGGWFQKLVKNTLGKERSGERDRFIQAFLTATLLFGIGPVGILGSIQDGLTGDYKLLAIKSILDGVSSIVFASTMGYGVAFSIIPIFLYQGLISLLAVNAQSIMSDSMVNEMTATGGIMLGAIALSSLLNIKKIRVSSMIPAFLVTPLIVWIMAKF